MNHMAEQQMAAQRKAQEEQMQQMQAMMQAQGAAQGQTIDTITEEEDEETLRKRK